jgi:hypothetical protein
MNQEAAKLSEPGIDSLNNPLAFVAANLSAIFIGPSLVVLPVWSRSDQCGAS